MREIMERALTQAQVLLDEFIQDPNTMEAMERVVDALAHCLSARGRVLVCGNGGSLCDAMHFAEEFSGRFRKDRESYPVIALSDPAHMSCVANDYGFEHVFSRQVFALGHAGDILVLLSTSGNSLNIVKAAEAAKERGMTVIGLLGRGGGMVGAVCDVVLEPPGEGSDRIQELHMLALHAMIEAVEARLGH